MRWFERTGKSLKANPNLAYWSDYQQLIQGSWKKSTPIKQVEFVVLDTETTGTDFKEDRVVSFGALKLINNELLIENSVDWKIQADLPSGRESIEIHGLLNDELDSGLPETTFVELLTRYIGSAVIVGYRPGFDMAILNRLVKERTGAKLINPTIDVFQLGMRLDFPLKPPFVNPEPYRLDRLCERFDVEQPDRHTAIGDAYATALVFLKLLERLKSQGIEYLGDLLRNYP